MDVFIIRRGGMTIEGGGGLNFEVVGGTTKPTSPKENTIWINTDTDVAGWAINWNDPSAMQSELYNDDISLTIGTYLKSDGTTSSSADWRYTDYISLPENTQTITVVTGTTSSSNPHHVLYDESGNRVSSIKRGTGINTYDVPSGAASIRLSLHKNDPASLVAVYPAKADEGFVWISNTSTEGFASFNALTENEILVNIGAISQYKNGQWEQPDAQIYQTGSWIEKEVIE